MTIAERPQHLRALDKASATRREAARQRHALVGEPPSVVLPALLDPPAELATYRLSTLFAHPTLIEGVGKLRARKSHARRWHTELRLDELTRPERERLVEAVTNRAPRAWREAA